MLLLDLGRKLFAFRMFIIWIDEFKKLLFKLRLNVLETYLFKVDFFEVSFSMREAKL